MAIKGIASPNTWGNYETCIEHKILQQGDLLMSMVTGREDHRMESPHRLRILRTVLGQVVDILTFFLAQTFSQFAKQLRYRTGVSGDRTHNTISC